MYVEYSAGKKTGADLRFLERGFKCINIWGFALLNLSHFS